MPDSPAVRGGIERWIVPALIILFCAGAFYVSTTFREMPPILKRGIQPSDFPQLLLGLIVFLTILMAWLDPIQIKDPLHRKVLGTIALFGVFAALSVVDLFLGLGVFAGALAAFWGERRLAVIALIGIVLPTAIFFLFDLAFEIRFPRGLLTNLWYG